MGDDSEVSGISPISSKHGTPSQISSPLLEPNVQLIDWNVLDGYSEPQSDSYSDSFILSISESFNALNSSGLAELAVKKQQLLSEQKMKEYKQLLFEVNHSYKKYKIREFLLGCCKGNELKIPQNLAARMRQVIVTSKLSHDTKLKRKTGETFNVLGLEDEDIENASKLALSIFEKNTLEKHYIESVKSKIEKLSSQKRNLNGSLDKHCYKIVPEIICEEREQLSSVYQSLTEALQEGVQKLASCGEMVQQLNCLKFNLTNEMRNIGNSFFKEKIQFIDCTISSLKHKLEQSVYMEKNYVDAMNALGDELQRSIYNQNKKVKSLKNTLNEYELREASSLHYKQIVSEYRRVKMELQHKRQTLNLLKDYEK